MGLHDILRGDIIPLSGTKVSIGRNRFDPPAPFVPVEEIIQNIAVFVDPASNTSGVVRFKGFVPTLEISLDGGVTFNSLLILASGINGQVLFNDNGTAALDPGLSYDKVLDILGVSGALHLKPIPNSLQTNFAVPPSGEAQFQAINLANRFFMGSAGSGSRQSNLMQPAFFAKCILMIFPNTGTTVGVMGDSVASVGTVSHPTPNVQSGVMMNFVSGASAGNTAGTGGNTTRFFRGGVSGVNTGFFFAARVALPNTSYDRLRAFVGLTTATMANAVGADDPAGDHCGFHFTTDVATYGKNWQFMTKDNVTKAIQNTTIQCSGNLLWDMFIYSPPFPNNGAIFWTIKDLSNVKEISGYQFMNLPRVNQAMRPGAQISNVSATARDIRIGHIYTEPE